MSSSLIGMGASLTFLGLVGSKTKLDSESEALSEISSYWMLAYGSNFAADGRFYRLIFF